MTLPWDNCFSFNTLSDPITYETGTSKKKKIKKTKKQRNKEMWKESSNTMSIVVNTTWVNWNS